MSWACVTTSGCGEHANKKIVSNVIKPQTNRVDKEWLKVGQHFIYFCFVLKVCALKIYIFGVTKIWIISGTLYLLLNLPKLLQYKIIFHENLMGKTLKLQKTCNKSLWWKVITTALHLKMVGFNRFNPEQIQCSCRHKDKRHIISSIR